jgi:hypothetical protein
MGKYKNDDEKPLAGWYDDPGSDDLLCYWDGEKFTNAFKPKPIPSTSRSYGGLTIVAFILGLSALLVCAFSTSIAVTSFFAVPGLILGGVALGLRGKPRWMSLSGLLTSAVAFLISIIVAVAGVASSPQPAPVVPDSQSSPSITKPAAEGGMGSYCDHIMLHFQEVVNVIAGGGKTTTAKDITDKLKDEGDSFSKGYDASMVGSEENVALLRDSGQAMLELRVAIIEVSEDVPAIGDRLLANFYKVKEICASG